MPSDGSRGNLRIWNNIQDDQGPTIFVAVYDGDARVITKTGEQTTLIKPKSGGALNVQKKYVRVVVSAEERKDLLPGEITVKRGGTHPVKLYVEIDKKSHAFVVGLTRANI